MKRTLIVLCVLLGGCCGPTFVDVRALEGSWSDIRARHDAYVQADPSLTPEDKDLYLTQTELYQRVLDTAGSAR